MSTGGTFGFVYPGQGTQRIGAASWFARIPAARAVFDIVSEAAGADILAISLRGPKSTLDDTRWAQPAIFAANAALNAILRDRGIVPDVVAGHSVGELNALVAAGCLSLHEGARLVVQRAVEMARVNRSGAMAAVAGLDLAQVEACCDASSTAAARAVVALHNGAQEYVISGDVPAVERAIDRARDAGASRFARLATSNAFHSPLMADAMPAWTRIVADAPIRQPATPIAVNLTGDFAVVAASVRTAVREQLVQPVRWHDVMRTFASAGVTNVVECGASRVLSGLARRFRPAWTTISLDAPAGLRDLTALCRPLSRSRA